MVLKSVIVLLLVTVLTVPQVAVIAATSSTSSAVTLTSTVAVRYVVNGVVVSTMSYNSPGSRNQSNTDSDWQYGVAATSVPFSTYDSALVTAQGLLWTTAPSDIEFWWVSSTTTGSNFAQEGWAYNGLPRPEAVCAAGAYVETDQAGLFYCYTVGSSYYGDTISPLPSGWSPSDSMYFVVQAYPTKNELQFVFYDTTVGQAEIVSVCNSGVKGYFQGSVGDIVEDQYTPSGNMYIHNTVPYAESAAVGQTYTGYPTVYDASAPSNTYIDYSGSGYLMTQIGMNQGTHYSGGTVLYSHSETLSYLIYDPSIYAC